MKGFILGLGLVLVTSFCYGEEYTGKSSNHRPNDKGVEFEVVVMNEQGEAIYETTQWVSTGIMTPDETYDAIDNVVDSKTQEVYDKLELGDVPKKKKAIEDSMRRMKDEIRLGIEDEKDATRDKIDEIVERMTQEVWAHIEGAEEVLANDAEVKNFRAKCNKYVPSELRPRPKDKRKVITQ